MAATQATAEPRPEAPLCDDAQPVYPCSSPVPAVQFPADAIRLPALEDSGREGIRSTMMPDLGGTAVLFQVSVMRNGEARLIAAWFRGHYYSGWRQREHLEANVSVRDYRLFAQRIDALLSQPEERPEDVICLHGANYYTQRRIGAETTTSRGGWCDGFSPNEAAHAMLAAFVCQQVDPTALPASLRRNCRRAIEYGRQLIRERLTLEH